jgi:hypothetical protein
MSQDSSFSGRDKGDKSHFSPVLCLHGTGVWNYKIDTLPTLVTFAINGAGYLIRSLFILGNSGHVTPYNWERSFGEPTVHC